MGVVRADGEGGWGLGERRVGVFKGVGARYAGLIEQEMGVFSSSLHSGVFLVVRSGGSGCGSEGGLSGLQGCGKGAPFGAIVEVAWCGGGRCGEWFGGAPSGGDDRGGVRVAVAVAKIVVVVWCGCSDDSSGGCHGVAAWC
ncbi:hypothetical protein Tco_0516510 [Tanacetum coccineum]